MKIAYYMPFKPMGHSNPSGDLIIGSDLFQFFQSRGHQIELISDFRCRWIYLKPYLWPKLIFERFRVLKMLKKKKPDLWLSYHSYYKAPDMLGPWCSRRLGIPYVLFQGLYATKYRRKLKSVAGFYLNRKVLKAASLVICNKKNDQKNLFRLLAENKVIYIKPGLTPKEFQFRPTARQQLRKQLQKEKELLILCVAMFRPGVKEKGIKEVIRCCAELARRGNRFQLLLAGDGTARERIEELAFNELADQVQFLGKVPRHKIADYYSAADIFVFPGFEEAIGMVYLEAQACGLPVVACREWGASLVVKDKQTGYLSPANRMDEMVANLELLLKEKELRKKMSEAAGRHVEQQHDLQLNYRQMEKQIEKLL